MKNCRTNFDGFLFGAVAHKRMLKIIKLSKANLEKWLIYGGLGSKTAISHKQFHLIYRQSFTSRERFSLSRFEPIKKYINQ
jgi:hypothetical protein